MRACNNRSTIEGAHRDIAAAADSDGSLAPARSPSLILIPSGCWLPKSLLKARKSATFTEIIPRSASNPAMQDQTLRFHFSKAITPSY
jgi:hypothetical protein